MGYPQAVSIFNIISAQYESSFPPQIWFYLDVLIRKLFTEVPLLWLTLLVNRREIPNYTGMPSNQSFYASKPNFEPQRAICQTVNIKEYQNSNRKKIRCSNIQSHRLGRGSFGLPQTINNKGNVRVIQVAEKNKGQAKNKGTLILKPLKGMIFVQ